MRSRHQRAENLLGTPEHGTRRRWPASPRQPGASGITIGSLGRGRDRGTAERFSDPGCPDKDLFSCATSRAAEPHSEAPAPTQQSIIPRMYVHNVAPQRNRVAGNTQTASCLLKAYSVLSTPEADVLALISRLASRLTRVLGHGNPVLGSTLLQRRGSFPGCPSRRGEATPGPRRLARD